MRRQVLDHLRRHGMLRAGDRLGLAVSGGADSIALWRLFLELAPELGVVLSVLHFHHGIRGAEADADQQFVAELADEYKVPLHLSRGDAPTYSREHRLSLETAARELRYAWFKELLAGGAVTKIATAHTLDDQAETVLMRLLRGAGTRGLGGIHPIQRLPLQTGSEVTHGEVIRPMLTVTRAQVLEYLRSLGQRWREDSSNLDPQHTRNRIRHELLPLLARDYNPSVLQVLARTADLARAEEEYWEVETSKLLPLLLLPGKPVRGGGRASSGTGKQSVALDIQRLLRHPLALQRRLLRATGERLGLSLDSEHVEQLLAVAEGRENAAELLKGWSGRRSFRELRFEPSSEPGSPNVSYVYDLPVPGKIWVGETQTEVSAQLVPVGGISESPGYNSARLDPELRLESSDLVLRNWHAGDRFRPVRGRTEKKVKELLQKMKVSREERAAWPVVAAGDRLVWMRGQQAPAYWVAQARGPQLLQIRETDVKQKEASR